MTTIRQMMKIVLSDMGFLQGPTRVRISGVSSMSFKKDDGTPVLEIWFWANPKGKLMHYAFKDYVRKKNPDFDKFFKDGSDYTAGIIDCQNGGMIIHIEG